MKLDPAELLDSLVATLTGRIPIDWLVALTVGAAALFLAWGGWAWFGAATDPTRRRLRALRESEDAELSSRPALPGWLERLSRYLGPRQPKQRSELHKRLVRAGFHAEEALSVLYLLKLLLALGLPFAVMAGLKLMPDVRTSDLQLFFYLVAAAYLGWLAPNFYLDRRLAARQRRLMAGLPDALDLLVTCTEAGLGLNAALERVAGELPASHPELARELALVNAEVRAGIDRMTALHDLAERTGLDEIQGLVSLIAHSARLGTGIAATLRVYAEEFRDRRLQRAEELAAMVGTKLIFPLTFCLFPSFFLVAVGPAVLRVLRVLSGQPLPGG